MMATSMFMKMTLVTSVAKKKIAHAVYTFSP